ncbi:hypothetical protein DPX16_0261 [Anabarilius grahami]|uniref:Uncharacterized protein n=1 Tax=Anabarilius grahami TaxID=495550 RepID=A0A3N0XHW8_ANAGA|nr:hypothetical protein DPX16_0261 [Anabarilius grahami]
MKRLYPLQKRHLSAVLANNPLKTHFSRESIFRVRNETAATLNSDQLWWILALFVIMVVLICFILRKMIFRMVRVLKPESVLGLSDPESDPESAVQMKLRSDESDSLNHSESEQINGSLKGPVPVTALYRFNLTVN